MHRLQARLTTGFSIRYFNQKNNFVVDSQKNHYLPKTTGRCCWCSGVDDGDNGGDGGEGGGDGDEGGGSSENGNGACCSMSSKKSRK